MVERPRSSLVMSAIKLAMIVCNQMDGRAEGAAPANGGADVNGPCRLCTRPGALIPIFTATGDVTLSAQAMTCAHIQVRQHNRIMLIKI